MFTELLLPAIPNHNKEKNELIPEIKISPNDVAWAKDIIAPRIREKYYARKYKENMYRPEYCHS